MERKSNDHQEEEKLGRKQHQQHTSRKKTSSEQCTLAAPPCSSKCMKDFKFCLTCLEPSLTLTFKSSLPPSTPTLLHTQSKIFQ